MENKEFIAASQLPVTEAKEVNVLCLENGELKQKPAGNLGGGGGGYVIHVKADEVDMSGAATNVISINSAESYDNYAEILFNGGSIWLDLAAMGEPMYVAVSAASFEVDAEVPTVYLMSTMFTGTAFVLIQLTATGTWKPTV